MPGKRELSADDGEYVLNIVSLFKGNAKPADRFERLVRPNIDILYRFAFRLCSSQDDAEELVQLFLTRLFPKIDQLEALEKPAPWLCRGLYNLYVDGYRKSVRESVIFSQDEFSEQTAVDEDTPYEQASKSELLTKIDAALQQLNDDQRIVVLLHDTEGYTLEELAEILQIPLGTAKSRLHRARNELKKLLSMEPFTEPGRVMGTER